MPYTTNTKTIEKNRAGREREGLERGREGERERGREKERKREREEEREKEKEEERVYSV